MFVCCSRAKLSGSTIKGAVILRTTCRPASDSSCRARKTRPNEPRPSSFDQLETGELPANIRCIEKRVDPTFCHGRDARKVGVADCRYSRAFSIGPTTGVNPVQRRPYSWRSTISPLWRLSRNSSNATSPRAAASPKTGATCASYASSGSAILAASDVRDRRG